MCRCGQAGCGLCQAKWAAPAVIAAHRAGRALLPLAVEVADPAVAQDGRCLTSRLHPQLQKARRGHAVPANAELLPLLAKHVRVHAPDLVIVGGVLQLSRPLTAAAGFRGIPLASVLAADGGPARLAAAIAAKKAVVLPGTDLVFDTATAVPLGGGGPVLVSAVAAHNPNGRQRQPAPARAAGGP